MKRILVVVDVQNDFCPGGSLAVADGERIIPTVNALINDARVDAVFATQDWHPAGHISFASTHNLNPFVTIDVSYGPQMVWPDHCVQGTKGAEFHPLLDTKRIQSIIRKGFRKDIDSYSGFFENDKKTATGLAELVNFVAQGEAFELIVAGIATDVCVLNTAMDARRILEYQRVTVVTDACAGVTPEGSTAAIAAMKEAGITCTRYGAL